MVVAHGTVKDVHKAKDILTTASTDDIAVHLDAQTA